MSLIDKKIGNYADNVKALSDYPSEDGISAERLKEIFDGRGDKEIKSSINGIISELVSEEGASQIGTTDGNVQEELNTLKNEVGKKANASTPKFNGHITIEKDDKEGAIVITPATMGELAKFKIYDASGICAGLGMDFDGKLTVSYGNVYIGEEEATGEVYTTLTHPYLDLTNEEIPDSVKMQFFANMGITDRVSTAELNLNGATIRREGEEVIIARPFDGIVPASKLKVGYDLMFNNDGNDYTVYHSGNLKDLRGYNNTLTPEEKTIFMQNTGLDETLGDIESALDSILAIQQNLIGGEAV